MRNDRADKSHPIHHDDLSNWNAGGKRWSDSIGALIFIIVGALVILSSVVLWIVMKVGRTLLGRSKAASDHSLHGSQWSGYFIEGLKQVMWSMASCRWWSTPIERETSAAFLSKSVRHRAASCPGFGLWSSYSPDGQLTTASQFQNSWRCM